MLAAAWATQPPQERPQRPSERLGDVTPRRAGRSQRGRWRCFEASAANGLEHLDVVPRAIEKACHPECLGDEDGRFEVTLLAAVERPERPAELREDFAVRAVSEGLDPLALGERVVEQPHELRDRVEAR